MAGGVAKGWEMGSKAGRAQHKPGQERKKHLKNNLVMPCSIHARCLWGGCRFEQGGQKRGL